MELYPMVEDRTCGEARTRSGGIRSPPHPMKQAEGRKKGTSNMKSVAAGMLLALTALVSVLGCSTGTMRSDPFTEDASEQEIKLFITNLAFENATIYGVTNGARRRLGQVSGKQEAEFTMPLRYTVEMYLEIDFLAGPTCYTERMVVNPGEHLELIVQANHPSLVCGAP